LLLLTKKFSLETNKKSELEKGKEMKAEEGINPGIFACSNPE